MISVTIEKNGSPVGRLEIRPKCVNLLAEKSAQFEANFSDFAATAFLNVYFDFWPEIGSKHWNIPYHQSDLLKSDTIKTLAKAILQLFPSVMAQEPRKTAMEEIKDVDPVEDIARGLRVGLSPGQFFEFEDTRRGRKKAIFELMQKVANLEHELIFWKVSNRY